MIMDEKELAEMRDKVEALWACRVEDQKRMGAIEQTLAALNLRREVTVAFTGVRADAGEPVTEMPVELEPEVEEDPHPHKPAKRGRR